MTAPTSGVAPDSDAPRGMLYLGFGLSVLAWFSEALLVHAIVNVLMVLALLNYAVSYVVTVYALHQVTAQTSLWRPVRTVATVSAINAVGFLLGLVVLGATRPDHAFLAGILTGLLMLGHAGIAVLAGLIALTTRPSSHEVTPPSPGYTEPPRAMYGTAPTPRHGATSGRPDAPR